MLLDISEYCNLQVEHVGYATYKISKFDPIVVGSDCCVVYSDLLLDDLCAIEELSRRYNKIYLVAVNSEQLKDSPYSSDKVHKLVDADAEISEWFDSTIIRNDSVSAHGNSVDGADAYCLCSATKIVEDLKSGKCNFRSITARMGTSLPARLDDGEHNAAQDPKSYMELSKYNVRFVTASDCRNLYQRNNYYKGDYKFLSEYVDKMSALNEEPCCLVCMPWLIFDCSDCWLCIILV